MICFVCEQMSWTYEEYMNQPTWFINTLILRRNIKTEIENKNAG